MAVWKPHGKCSHLWWWYLVHFIIYWINQGGLFYQWKSDAHSQNNQSIMHSPLHPHILQGVSTSSGEEYRQVQKIPMQINFSTERVLQQPQGGILYKSTKILYNLWKSCVSQHQRVVSIKATSKYHIQRWGDLIYTLLHDLWDEVVLLAF